MLAIKKFDFGTVKWTISLLYLFTLIGCSSTGLTPVGSKSHKATILYFEGGGGQIHKPNVSSSNRFLIHRSRHYFESNGIRVTFLGFNFSNPSVKDQIARTTESHFQIIQKKVDSLKEKGHEHIWLMGLSNGAISVMHAGASGIKRVDGLIVINPPRFIYNRHTRSGTIVDFRNISLPILLITHELDNCRFKNWSKQFLRIVFPSSANPEMVTFSGGHTGNSPEATHLSQLYQHGLRGLEKEFSRTVIDFINSSSDSSATVKKNA